jgi:hypothetical protein
MDELAPATPQPPVSAEDAESLARELGKAYARTVTWYREQMHMSADQADGTARGKDDPKWAERALHDPPDQVSWPGLSRLAEHDPDAALAAWERVKAAARDELASGHRVASELSHNGPWERAQFLAIRQAFREEWQPRGGIEGALIDTMAQAYSAYLAWVGLLHAQSRAEASRVDRQLEREGRWGPRNMTVAEAMEQSAAMADRFHRLFLRTLRALRDLRRYVPAVIVQNAGQVNLGHTQVNQVGLRQADGVGRDVLRTRPSPAETTQAQQH